MKALVRRLSLFTAAVLVTVPLLGLTQGARRYEVVPNHFPAQPDGKLLGPTHGGAAVDRAGNVYISTDTDRGILVFGPNGKFLRSFGPTQIHGLFLRRERDGEYLYAARPNFSEVTKIKIDGTMQWTMGYPVESGKYASAAEFHPTNVVSTPDGSIFVADGYGKNFIHKYDASRKYLKSFGGQGASPAEEGRFNRCHGLAVDTRRRQPMLVVCNRESGRVEHWDTEGNFIKVLVRDLRMPAGVQVGGDSIAIAELGGRVTVLGKDDQIVAQVGDNPDAKQRANYGLEPIAWSDANTNAPHGVTFDRAGNLIVAEWSKFGRVSKFDLKR